MRLLSLVAGRKWTGTAAVVFDQTAALVEAGVEAQFGFVGDSPLAERLSRVGWARPLLRPLRGPFDYWSEVRRVREALARERFDVVHAHATHDHYVAAWALSERWPRGRPRLVRTVHNVRHARRDLATRMLFSRTDAFAFGNAGIAQSFGRSGPVHSPVVDAARFRPAESAARARETAGLPRNGGRLLVGTVGKMAEGRGHREALAAAAPLPSVTLVHVGHGELLRELQELARASGSGARNIWTGYQEENLPRLYQGWDAFLFPASGSDQGQRAILEAMASGLPVVALEVPGVRDLMTDGEEGFVVGTPSELGPALARLAGNPELRREMGARARRRALEFTGPKFAMKAREFYEATLRGDAEDP